MRIQGQAEARANARFVAEDYSQTAAPGPNVLGLELIRGVDEGGTYRVAPASATYGAHDMLLGLQHATGFFLYSYSYRQNLDTTEDWYDWEGNLVAQTNGDENPGWPGFRDILELLKGQLREALVVGDREFDLGFQVEDPSDPLQQGVAGDNWGPAIGFMQTWPRTNHLVLRVRDVVYLIVTRSQDDLEIPLTQTTFEFGHPSLVANADVTVLYPDPGDLPNDGSTLQFSDTISGIDARVYRIELP